MCTTSSAVPPWFFDSACRALRHACPPCLAAPPMLGRFMLVYMRRYPHRTREDSQHLVHVLMLVETLRHHKLYAKASKCQSSELCRSSGGFLSRVISEQGVASDPRKVSAVAEWATPTCCSDVRRFIGLANYYRKLLLLLTRTWPPAPATACRGRALLRRAAASCWSG